MVLVLLPRDIGKDRKPWFSVDLVAARDGAKEAALTAAGTAARPRRIDLEIIVMRHFEYARVRGEFEVVVGSERGIPPLMVVQGPASKRKRASDSCMCPNVGFGSRQ